MDEEWLSYSAAGERLGISAEAARQRAIRGNWPRRRSNEGGTVIRVPEGVRVRRRTPVEQPSEQSVHTYAEHPAERLVTAMQAHIETLQADVALARSELAELRADYRRIVDELLVLKANVSAPAPAPAPARRKSAPVTEEGKAAASERMRQILERLNAERQAS